MIASMYNLSRSDCKRLNIKDLYSIHKVIYSLFPMEGEKCRDFLFVDKGGTWDQRSIMILSKRTPQTPTFGTMQSKPVPDSFLNHQFYGFEIKLNPTYRDGKSRKNIPVRGQQQLLEWFTGKAQSYGFNVEKGSLQVSNMGVVQFDKEGAVCTYNSATFIGKMLVQDRAKFVGSFENGIGRGKAFGFGLLQIVPLANE